MKDLTNTMIAGSILATALGFMLVREVAHSAMHIEIPENPAYALASAQGDENTAIEVELPFPQADWIAAMDPVRGAKIFKKCTSCHNAEQGGNNGTGPNLWNIVGQQSAKRAGFSYSSAMTNSGFIWNYETLNDYLTKPTKYLQGTNMNFVGLKKDGDRAAVIAYLRAQSDTPFAMPLPASSPQPMIENSTTEVSEVEDGAVIGGTLQDSTKDMTDTVKDAIPTEEKIEDKIIEDKGEDITGSDH